MSWLIMKLAWISFIFVLANLYPISLLSIQTSTPIQLNSIQDFDLSPDDKRIVVIDSSHVVKVTEIETGETLFQLEGSSSHLSNIISWSSSGQYIVGGFDDGVRLWDANTGSLLHLFTNQVSNDLGTVKISPNGKLLATASQQDFSVTIFELTSYKAIFRLSLGQDSARDVFFNPDSSLVAVEQIGNGISIWDLNTGGMLFRFPGQVASLSPDGKMIATGEGRLTSNISVWNISSGELLQKFEAALSLFDLQWSSNNKNLFGQLSGGILVDEGYDYSGEAVREWSIDSNQEVNTFSHTTSLQLPIDLDASETIIGVGNGQAKDSVLIWNKMNEKVYRKAFSSVPLKSYEITDKKIYGFGLSSEDDISIAYKDELIIYSSENKNQLASFPLPSPARKIKISSATGTVIVLLADETLLTFHLPL